MSADCAVVLGNAPKIGSGAERTVAGTGDDHDTDVVVRSSSCDAIPETMHHVERHRVPTLRSVDGQVCDAVPDVVFEVGHGGIVDTSEARRPLASLTCGSSS